MIDTKNDRNRTKVTKLNSKEFESENFTFTSFTKFIEDEVPTYNTVDYVMKIAPKSGKLFGPHTLRSYYVDMAKKISEIDVNGEFPFKTSLGWEWGMDVSTERRDTTGDFKIKMKLDGDEDQTAVFLEYSYIFTKDDLQKFVDCGKYLSGFEEEVERLSGNDKKPTIEWSPRSGNLFIVFCFSHAQKTRYLTII